MLQILQIAQLILWEFGIPLAVGTLFWEKGRYGKGFLFAWVSGQFLLWAVFQASCVPLILLQIDFVYLMWLYAGLAGALTVAALLRRRAVVHKTGENFLPPLRKSHKRRKQTLLYVVRDEAEQEQTASNQGAAHQAAAGGPADARGRNRLHPTQIFWGIFAALLLLQLLGAVFMTYADGDDAYYVATTTVTNNADTMYRKLPYTGGATELDVRHGLAPFPIWIAFLAEVSGIHSATTAHIAVPLMLIPMTYAIFYLLGERIFAEKPGRIPLFLTFTEVLVLFGDYSYYTAENFMLARSRQGKAALGSIVIPMMFLLLLYLLEQWQEQKKPSARYWILLCSVMMTACLCSTLGALLGCMLVGIVGLCGAFSYRRWSALIPMGLCVSPCVLFALIYLIQN